MRMKYYINRILAFVTKVKDEIIDVIGLRYSLSLMLW